MIRGTTTLIAHFGDPIAPVKAPMIYNPYFERAGIDAVVVPMGVRAVDYPVTLRSVFRFTNIRGALVTMPHKVATVDLLDDASTTVKVAGSCNAILRRDDGTLCGDLFDGAGFVAGSSARALRCAARAVSSSGRAASAPRSPPRWRPPASGRSRCTTRRHPGAMRCGAPAAALSGARGAHRHARPEGFDLVANGTPLGMNPDDPLPVDVTRLSPSTFVGEVVMKQEVTPLLRAARERGCPTQIGTDMLFEQIPLYLEFFGFGQVTADELRAVAASSEGQQRGSRPFRDRYRDPVGHAGGQAPRDPRSGLRRRRDLGEGLVTHPGGVPGAVAAIRASGLRVAASSSSRTTRASTRICTIRAGDRPVADGPRGSRRGERAGRRVVDLALCDRRHGEDRRRPGRLAHVAAPRGIRIAFGAPAWARWISEYPAVWEAVRRADAPNLGVLINVFHLLAKGTPLDALDAIPGERIFLVQMADYLGDLRDISETADHRRAFPNESAHRHVIADMLRKVHRAGYRGDYVFEVFNDEYLHLAPESVMARARKAAQWVVDQTSREHPTP